MEETKSGHFLQNQTKKKTSEKNRVGKLETTKARGELLVRTKAGLCRPLLTVFMFTRSPVWSPHPADSSSALGLTVLPSQPSSYEI